MNYVQQPNFPEGKATVVAVSSLAERVKNALASAKIAVIPVEPNENLPKGIASHADLQLLHLGGKSVLTSACSENTKDMLNALGFEHEEMEKAAGDIYPQDCLINMTFLGKNSILNPDTVDPKILQFLEKNDYNMIAVKQGYTKCAILSVCEDAIITADHGIAKIAEDYGIEVLEIRDDKIHLEGYANGFIGGCGGMVEKGILGTSGDLRSIQDCNNIKDFLRNRNIYAENLGGKELWDIGGILPLCEE